MENGERFDAFAQNNASLGEREFLAAFPDPFLVSEGSIPSVNKKKAVEKTDHSGQDTKKRKKAAVEGEPLVVLVKRGPKGRESIVTVGRSEDCDIAIESTQVSKRHAYFTHEGDDWLLSDAESTNGTFVDGKRMKPHEKHALADSEAIRFSPEICFRFFTPAAFYRYMSYRVKMKK